MSYQDYADAFFNYVPPKTVYREAFDANIDEWFENAPNVFSDIQHEVTYGKRDFEFITGRVDSVISITTGQKLGDDFKNFIFPNILEEGFPGKLFKWKGSYWIAVNSDNFESVSNSCIVRRCNNMLKWVDKKGNIISEPCIIAETIKQSNDYNGDKLTTVSGFMNLFCQKNERTNTIISNQRFLFGTKENRKAFRVFGDGVKNFLNSITDDDMSPSVIELTIGGSYISPEVDDIENGIANRFLDSFSVKIDGGDFSDIVGTTKAMTATATSNGATINGVPFTWTSSNPLIATIDSDGNMELLAVGSATITCQIGINNLVKDTISVTVSDIKQDDYDVVYTPAVS